MDSSQSETPNKSFAGLFFQIGTWSWFWGRGAPPGRRPVSPSATPAQGAGSGDEPWSGLAAWLRHMHAQADRLPVKPAPRAAPVADTEE